MPSTRRALEVVAGFQALYSGDRTAVTAGCPEGWLGSEREASILSNDETCSDEAILADCVGPACAIAAADFDGACVGLGAQFFASMRCDPPATPPDLFRLTASSGAQTIEVVAPFVEGTWDCAPPVIGGNPEGLIRAAQNDLATVRLTQQAVTVQPVAGEACSITITRAAGRAIEGSLSMTYRNGFTKTLVPLTATFRDDVVTVGTGLVGTSNGDACTAAGLTHQTVDGALQITATGVTCGASGQPDLVVVVRDGTDDTCGGADDTLQLLGPAVQASTDFGSGSCTAELVERTDDQVVVRFPSVVLCAPLGCQAFEDVGLTYALR